MFGDFVRADVVKTFLALRDSWPRWWFVIEPS